MRILVCLGLLLIALSTASAHAQLHYMDWTPQGQACCLTADANGDVFVVGTIVKPSPQNPQILQSSVSVTKLDPHNNVVYTFEFGSDNQTTPKAVALDSEGNLFIVGSTSVSGFPLVNPIVSQGPASGCCGTGFVSKLNAAGTQLLFSTLVGGTTSGLGGTSVNAIALDASGDVFLTGSTNAADFPVTANAYQKAGPVCGSLKCPSYAFLTELTNAGDKILYSTFIGDGDTICFGGSSCVPAAGHSAGNAIGLAADGTVTIAGYTTASKFPVTAGAFQTTCNCSVNASAGFVIRFSADGQSLVWSSFLGGGGATAGSYGGASVQSLALTAGGSTVVAGNTSSDFPVTSGAFQTSFAAHVTGYGPNANSFVAKLNPQGTELVFSTYLGGSIHEDLYGLQLDSQGNPWVTGTTLSPDFPSLPNSLNIGNAWVAELASDGSALLQSTRFPTGAAGQALVLDSAGNQILLGSSGSLLRIPAGGPQGLSVLGQANAEGYSVSGHVAPGEIISLYGTGLGPDSAVGGQLGADRKLLTNLASTEVLFDGTPAPLLYVSQNQINAIVPFGVGGEPSTRLQVIRFADSVPEMQSAGLTLNVVPADPEIFIAAFPAVPGAPTSAAALNEDGTVNSESNPAEPGSIVTFYANGAGLFAYVFPDGSIVEPALPAPVLPVSVIFDSNTLSPPSGDILYAGAAPGLVAGVLQVNVRIPQSIAAGGYHTVALQAGDQLSDPVRIAVQAPTGP